MREPLRPDIGGHHDHRGPVVYGGTFNAPDGGVYPNLPAFCRVAANLTPTSDSDINIEVWMPFSAWNGKFLGLGTGSFGGFFFYDLLARYPRSTIP